MQFPTGFHVWVKAEVVQAQVCRPSAAHSGAVAGEYGKRSSARRAIPLCYQGKPKASARQCREHDPNRRRENLSGIEVRPARRTVPGSVTTSVPQNVARKINVLPRTSTPFRPHDSMGADLREPPWRPVPSAGAQHPRPSSPPDGSSRRRPRARWRRRSTHPA